MKFWKNEEVLWVVAGIFGILRFQISEKKYFGFARYVAIQRKIKY